MISTKSKVRTLAKIIGFKKILKLLSYSLGNVLFELISFSLFIPLIIIFSEKYRRFISFARCNFFRNAFSFSLCYNQNFACYIPINHKNLDDKKNKEQISETKVLQIIKSICCDPAILKIGHNIKYDIRILNKYGIYSN